MYKIRGADGKEYGPASADVMRKWIQQRRANGQTLVQGESDGIWKPLSEFPEFAGDLDHYASAPVSAGTPAVVPGLAASQPGPYNPAGPRTNPLAITSLVLGILSLLCCGMLGIFFGILALVFGGLGMAQIKKSTGTMPGRGMAIAGIVMGSVGIIAGSAVTVWLFNGGREWLMEQLQKK